MSKNEITKLMDKVKKDKVAFIDLQFTDFFGNIKNSTVPVYRLEGLLKRGAWIDGSSIQGFARIHESDMYLMPDISTYALLPWRNNIDTGKVARIICDVYTPKHEPFEGDPRFILKKVLKEAKTLGFDYYTAPECEFFIFPKDNEGKVMRVSKGNGYYWTLVMDESYSIKREIMESLAQMNIKAETSTHEVADNQHELTVHYGDALKIADDTITLKMATRFIAHKHGYHASFMPKPFYGINGSGMHIHQSLWKSGKNVFYNKNDKYGFSKTAYQFLAGQLKYATEIAAILAPIVNSYKRLTPGFEAPVYVCWARINRSALIRIPMSSKGTEETSCRMEIRCPDPSSNPYLAFAALLKTGLNGIKDKLQTPKPVEEDVYEFDDSKLKKYYIDKLPATLEEAINLMKKGCIVRKLMGDYTFDRYLEAKKQEWDSFRTHVTDWEIKRYFGIV